MFERQSHRLNIELDLQSLFGLHVHSFTHWLRPRIPPPPPIWAHIRGRYWSAKIETSLFKPLYRQYDKRKGKQSVYILKCWLALWQAVWRMAWNTGGWLEFRASEEFQLFELLGYNEHTGLYNYKRYSKNAFFSQTFKGIMPTSITKQLVYKLQITSSEWTASELPDWLACNAIWTSDWLMLHPIGLVRLLDIWKNCITVENCLNVRLNYEYVLRPNFWTHSQSLLLTDFTSPPFPPCKRGLTLVCNINIVYGNLKSENSED